MKVHFYQIYDCKCDNVDGRPVIVAPVDKPENILRDLLTYYQFVQLPDGRWVHFLTPKEYAHVMNGYPDRDVTFNHLRMPEQPGEETPEEKEKGNRLGWFTIGMFALSYIPVIIFGCLGGFNGDPFQVPSNSWFIAVTVVWGISQFISVCLTYYARNHYPLNLICKISMGALIIQMPLLIMYGCIMTLSACANACVNSCGSCIGSCVDSLP